MSTPPRITIFVNGHPPQPDLRKRLRPDDLIACADGGTRHAVSLGLRPHIIIGDLDSTPPALVERLAAQGTLIQQYPRDKDKTDLELTLDWAVAQPNSGIMLLTAIGSRLDQTLANLLLLTQPAYQTAKFSFADEHQTATLVRSGEQLTIHGKVGDILSLIPLTPTVTQVDLTGVGWPLQQATLEFGSSYTVSNALAQPTATVSIGAGMVLAVHIDGDVE